MLTDVCRRSCNGPGQVHHGPAAADLRDAGAQGVPAVAGKAHPDVLQQGRCQGADAVEVSPSIII